MALPLGPWPHSVFKNYGPSSFAFLMTWTDLTKDNLELQWPLWRSFNLPKFVSLRTKLEDHNSKRQQIEWVPISVDILRLYKKSFLN